jgi:dolichol-phosphate mannosyltransferase
MTQCLSALTCGESNNDNAGHLAPNRPATTVACRDTGSPSSGQHAASETLEQRQVQVTGSQQPARARDRVVVVMPTYNERENLEPMTGRVRSAVPAADLLVVDDNSPDGTGEIADKLAAADSHVHVLHRAGKAGLGAAYIAGFRWALDHGYGAVVEMDADGSHQPEELPALLAALDSADLVLGSRWVPGGRVVNWAKSRELLSRGGNTYARLLLGIRLKDATGGYRAYRAGTLRRLALDEISSQGYCFQIDLAFRTVQAGLNVVEVPITFVERAHGASKMSRSIVAEAFWRVPIWGITRRWRADQRTARLRLCALAVACACLLGTSAAAFPPDQGKPLSQNLFEVRDGTALTQHVPVTAGRLNLLGRGEISGRGERDCPAHPAFPGRGNLGLSGERHAKVVPVGAVKTYLLTRCQVRVTVILIARCSEPGAAKCTFRHVALPPRRSAFHVLNAGYPDKIPTRPDSNPCPAVLARVQVAEKP